MPIDNRTTQQRIKDYRPLFILPHGAMKLKPALIPKI